MLKDGIQDLQAILGLDKNKFHGKHSIVKNMEHTRESLAYKYCLSVTRNLSSRICVKTCF